MLRDDFVNYRQADTAAAFGTRRDAAREWRPDLLPLARWYSGSFIGDGEHDFAITLRQNDTHCLFVRPILDGIVEEVEQDVTQRFRSHRECWTRFDRCHDLYAPRRGQRPELVDDALDLVGEVRGRRRRRVRAADA
jgi:hypothetical protein